ncbi:hypothetical protein AAFF_G00310370 [Aldrovandia affinis]|uniref:Uncharacterized protein n=1 Tax=Aldrovandia affinis TaxID=143900 RepID=A0AAD7W0V3_9TELE|nr:hypothetical protein AAFF_G00310370 [Aldrovandia affinis]
MAKTRQVVGEQAEADGESGESTGDEVTVASAVQRVLIKQSPYLDAFHEHLPAKVNMGPVQPPQRKGRVPQYSRGQLQELQAQFDMLEGMSVFKKPEDVDVSVEYVNPSFLIKKPGGGFRLVTAFADVGRYSKPQPP